jgi:hypothetical protein
MCVAGIWRRRGSDFGAGLSCAVRLRQGNWVVFRWCDALLPRRCFQFQRHVPEGRQKRERSGQVHNHAPY